MTRVRRLLTVTALTALALLVGVAAVGASAAPAAAAPGAAPARRVLIVSLPMVSWADLGRADTPVLDRFVRSAAVAGLSTRVDQRETALADGYATLGAGTRAVGTPETDGDGLGVDEAFGATTAGDAYRQRTGVDPTGAIVDVGWPLLTDANGRLHYDAVLGAFGAALHGGGRTTAVIGNADGREPDVAASVLDATPPPARQRQAVLGLADRRGQVDAGVVDRSLLADDPAAPFGVVLDPAAVESAFTDVWADGAVVLVEASDLVRVARYRPYATATEHRQALDDALTRADALVGRLLAHTGPRDLVMVMGPAHRPGTVHLTPLAARGPGIQPGLLRSPGTRRSGFVQIQDLAPTVLAAVGIERPDAMEGRPATTGSTGGAAADRTAFLRRADATAQLRDGRIGGTYGVLVGALVVTALLGAAACWWRPRLGGLARFVAQWSIGLLTAAFLVRMLGVDGHGEVAFYAVWIALGAVCGAVATAIGRLGARTARGDLDGVWAGGAVLVAFLTVDAVRGAPSVLNSVLGYSPTVAGRFAGFGNPAYAAFSAAALVVAVLGHRRVGGGLRGLLVAAGVLGLAVVIDVAPMWGSDVGGILSMVPAYAVVLLVLAGVRLRVRTVLVALGALVVVLAAAVAVDVARPASERTHLGRLAVDLANGRTHELSSVVLRKLGDNLATVGTSILGLAVVATLVGLVVLRRWGPDRIAAVRAAVPGGRALDLGMVVLAVLGFATNDSGMAVPGIMLVVYVAVWVQLLVTCPPVVGPDGGVGAAPAAPAAHSADVGAFRSVTS